MFGHSYFGAQFFGPDYWGPGLPASGPEGPDGGWARLTARQRRRLARMGEEQRKRVLDGWNDAIRERDKLRQQIMRSLEPEVLGVQIVNIGEPAYDDEDDIEALMMVH